MAAIEILPGSDAIASQPTFEHRDAYELPLVGPNMAIKNDLIVNVHEDLSAALETAAPTKETPGLYITGMGQQYPPFLFMPDKLEGFVKKWYDLDTPG